MDESILAKQVEEYLNKERVDLVISIENSYSSQDKFRMQTVKRLKYTFDLYNVVCIHSFHSYF